LPTCHAAFQTRHRFTGSLVGMGREVGFPVGPPNAARAGNPAIGLDGTGGS